MPTVLQLREKRGNAIKLGRDLIDRADREKRPLNAEERQQWDRAIKEADDLKGEIDQLEKQEALEREMNGSLGRRAAAPDLDADPRTGKRKKPVDWSNPRERRRSKLYGNAFRAWLLEGANAFRHDELRGKISFGARDPELRDLQADADISGGYMVAPQKFLEDIIIFKNNFVWMRRLCTVQTVTNAQSLGVPSLDTDVADADWTSELATGSDDTSMAVGKREFYPHPVAKRIKVSNKLLRLTPAPEQLVRKRLGYKFGVTEEKAFLTGTGSQQPLGIFTASANGVPSTQDVTSSITGSFNSDDIIALKMNVKAQHQAVGVFFGSRTVIQNIMQLKDGDGRYIWAMDGFTKGIDIDGQGYVTDSLLGRPIFMSEYAPSTIATGQYLLAFFNPEFYWIADAQEMEVQRLVELYAETNQTGFIARQALDGMPVLAEAFTRLKAK